MITTFPQSGQEFQQVISRKIILHHWGTSRGSSSDALWDILNHVLYSYGYIHMNLYSHSIILIWIACTCMVTDDIHGWLFISMARWLYNTQKEKTEEELERRERELVEEQKRLAEEKVRREQEAKRRRIEVCVYMTCLYVYMTLLWIKFTSVYVKLNSYSAQMSFSLLAHLLLLKLTFLKTQKNH